MVALAYYPWGPGAGRPLVGCKGNALLGCPRGKAPRKLKGFLIFKSLKWPLLEDKNKKMTPIQAYLKCSKLKFDTFSSQKESSSQLDLCDSRAIKSVRLYCLSKLQIFIDSYALLTHVRGDFDQLKTENKTKIDPLAPELQAIFNALLERD